MAMTTTILNNLARGLGVVQIVLGLLFWTGNVYFLIGVHIICGLLLVLCLWCLAVVGIFARIGWPIALGAIAWGLFVVALGMSQNVILPGTFHWIVQLFHLLVGLAAIGLAENLAKRIHANRAARPQAQGL